MCQNAEKIISEITEITEIRKCLFPKLQISEIKKKRILKVPKFQNSEIVTFGKIVYC